MRFYKRDPDRALAGMTELTLQERGAYNTILDALYSRDGILRDDDDFLRRVVNCHGNEWRAVKAKLIAKGKIWIEDGFVKARGVEATMEDASKVSVRQRKNIDKRWETERKLAGNSPETRRKQPGNASENSEKANKINGPPIPLITKNTDKEDTANAVSIYPPEFDFGGQPAEPEFPQPSKLKKNGVGYLYPDAFLLFWDTYPTSGNDTKISAYKAWFKGIKLAPPSDLQNGAEQYAAYVERTSCYPKHVATWINAEGWTADYAIRQPVGNGTGGGRAAPKSATELAANVARRMGYGGMDGAG